MAAEQCRKLFIGGLESTVTEEVLKSYFEDYGIVVDAVVLKDWETGRSRGFGFVTFTEPFMVDAAQAYRPHIINGRQVELKRAVPKRYFEDLDGHLTVQKLFVGGLEEEVEAEDLREYFETFGTIRNVDVIVDRDTNRKRGFAFVEFNDYDPVDKIILLGPHLINEKKVEVKKALTRHEMRFLRRPRLRDVVNNMAHRTAPIIRPYAPGFGPFFAYAAPTQNMAAHHFADWSRSRHF